MDIQILFWFCRYQNVLIIPKKYLCFWIFSARYPSRRFITMDIYAPSAPGQGTGPSRGATGAVQAGAKRAHERFPPARAVRQLHQQRR